MKKDLVSIIVLSYNNWDYYKECLDSIFSQNYKNIELIFSNDGYEHYNKIAIEKYINKNKSSNIKNVILNYNNKNLGTVKHLNKLLKISNGNYIKTIAVDDLLYEPSVIKNLVNTLKKSNKLFCCGFIYAYDENMINLLKKYPDPKMFNKLKKSSVKEKCKMLSISAKKTYPAPGRFYSKKYFEKYGFYDEEYILQEDLMLLLTSLEKGLDEAFYFKPVVKYRLGGMSNGKRKNCIFEEDFNKFKTNYRLKNFGLEAKKIKQDIVIWGTGSLYEKYEDFFSGFKIKYFVDSDKKKKKNSLNGKKIYLPKKLLEESKNKITVVICSSFYFEIKDWLTKEGFVEDKDFVYVELIKFN